MNCCVWWWSSWINGRSHLGPYYLLIAVLPVAEEDSCNRSLRPQPTAARHTHAHTQTHAHSHTYITNKQTNVHSGTHTLKYPNTLKQYASRNQRVELNSTRQLTFWVYNRFYILNFLTFSDFDGIMISLFFFVTLWYTQLVFPTTLTWICHRSTMKLSNIYCPAKMNHGNVGLASFEYACTIWCIYYSSVFICKSDSFTLEPHWANSFTPSV